MQDDLAPRPVAGGWAFGVLLVDEDGRQIIRRRGWRKARPRKEKQEKYRVAIEKVG